MVVHNITIKVDPSIEDDWRQWQLKEHIPALIRTSLFTEHRFYKLLDQDDEEGATYIIQLFANTAAELNEYFEQHAPALAEKATQKWGNQFISFRTTMETVK